MGVREKGSDPYDVLGVEGGEGGEVEVVDPSGRCAVEGHLPELHVLHHELVGALHVVERPAGVVLAQVLDEHLPWARMPKSKSKSKSSSMQSAKGLRCHIAFDGT